jgi:hypothetical protein
MNGRLLRPRATGVDPRSISGVVAYWPMNESAEIANVNADDASGGGMHLTSSGALSDAGRSGRGRLLAASGTEWNPTGGSLARSVATTSTPHWVAAASGWTVALWVKTDLTYSTQGTSTVAALIAFNSILGVNSPNVRLAGGTPANGFTSLSTRCYFTDGTFAQHIFTGNLAATAPAGQWTHLAFVADPNSLTYTIYRNGAVLATIAYASGKVLADFSSGLPCTMNWPGALDELVIYNRAITAGEVARLAGTPDRPTGASSLHPDCRSWISRVLTNGGTLSQSTVNAVNQFCLDIAAAGIRDRFYRVNLFCGDQLAAALVPLYRGPTTAGAQFGNTNDTAVSFVSGDYNASIGLINGLGKYLRTGLGKLYAGARGLTHMAFVLQPSPTEDSLDLRSFIGGAEASNNEAMSATLRLTTTVAPNTFGLQAAFPPTSGGAVQRIIEYAPRTPKKLIVFSRTADANPGIFAYEDGTQKASATGTFTGDMVSNGELAVFAVWSNSAGAPLSGATSNTRMSMYSFGLAMTQIQVTAYTQAVNTMLAALGRS